MKAKGTHRGGKESLVCTWNFALDKGNKTHIRRVEKQRGCNVWIVYEEMGKTNPIYYSNTCVLSLARDRQGKGFLASLTEVARRSAAKRD